MIENPSNLTQQLLNLVERVAVEIRAIYNKLKTAVFKVNGQTPDSDGNIQIDAVTKATQDGDGNVISNTYVKKTDKVTNASSADSATKATQDASGNVITSTYATKTEVNAKAPTSHASTATTYGIGTGSNYGHVKLSDSTSSTSTASSGVAASPKAVKAAYDLANTANTAAATAITNANNALTAANSAVKKVNGTAPGSDGNVEIEIPSSVHVGTSAPTDADTSVWIDTDEADGLAVTSVNGQKPNASGNVNVDVTLTKDKVTSALGYTPLQTAPVTSVMGKTGAVTGLVTSVNGKTGAVTIDTGAGSGVKRSSVVNISKVTSYKVPNSGLLYVTYIENSYSTSKHSLYVYSGNTLIGTFSSYDTFTHNNGGDTDDRYKVSCMAYIPVTKDETIYFRYSTTSTASASVSGHLFTMITG